MDVQAYDDAVDPRVRDGSLLRQVPRGSSARRRAPDRRRQGAVPGHGRRSGVAGVDPVRAVRRPGDAGPSTTRDEARSSTATSPRADRSGRRERGVRRLVPADPRRRGQRRHGQPERHGDCFSEVSLVNTALWYQQAVDRRQGGRRARARRRRRPLHRRRRRGSRPPSTATSSTRPATPTAAAGRRRASCRSRSAWSPTRSRRRPSVIGWSARSWTTTVATSTPASSGPATSSTRWLRSAASTSR